jgi:ABC-2 type transport system permease protein
VTAPAPVAPLAPAGSRAQPPARFGDLVRAEWIKMRSLRSTPWTFALAAVVVIGSAVIAARADYTNFPHYSLSNQRDPGFSLADAFPLIGYMTLMLIAVSTGAIAIVSEYSSGLIRTTTVAVPARGAVLLAKAVVVAAVWTVASAVISAVSFTASQAILHGRHAGDSITHPGALAALAGATLLAPVCALIGLGLGTVIRHSATTMVGGVAVLLLVPSFFSTRHPWSADLNHAMVLAAFQRLTETYGPPSDAMTLYASFTGSWVVYAAWPLAAMVLAFLVIRWRDV